MDINYQGAITMSWNDENNEEGLIKSVMECDFCEDSIIWYDKDDDYDNPTQDNIDNAKKTNGWASVDIHKYEDDPERPTDIEVGYITLHLCPKCRKSKLGILIVQENR